jgi:hypothetical protein
MRARSASGVARSFVFVFPCRSCAMSALTVPPCFDVYEISARACERD